jgi:hypothetical protein
MSTVEVSAENQECAMTVSRCVFVADCGAFVLSVSFQPVSFSVSLFLPVSTGYSIFPRAIDEAKRATDKLKSYLAINNKKETFLLKPPDRTNDIRESVATTDSKWAPQVCLCVSV